MMERSDTIILGILGNLDILGISHLGTLGILFHFKEDPATKTQSIWLLHR
jgi:hypothetical protein